MNLIEGASKSDEVPHCESDGDDDDEFNEGGDQKLKDPITLKSLVDPAGALFELEPSSESTQPKAAEYKRENVEHFLNGDFQLGLEDGDEGFENVFSNFAEKSLKMENLTPDGGVKKRIKRTGLISTGDVPENGTVTVHYDLYFEDNDFPFDSSRLRGRPEKFLLGVTSLISGLEIALKSMKKQEIAHFLLRPEYAYGKLGSPPRIPPNAEVFAVVELIDFSNEADVDSLLTLSPEERNKRISFRELQSMAGKLHQEGNHFFQQKEYKLATKRYTKACRLLENYDLADENEEKEQRRQLLKLYLNLGETLLKLNSQTRACTYLQKALRIDPKNAKGLYRYARAKRGLGNLNEAEQLLRSSLALSPNSIDVRNELASLREQIREAKNEETARCKLMFPGFHKEKEKTLEELRGKISQATYQAILDDITDFLLDKDMIELSLSSALNEDELAVAKAIALQKDLIVNDDNPKKLKLTKKN